MEKNLIGLSYDKESDVLYMSFGTPGFGIDEETEDGIFVRRDETDHKIIGLTIMDFEKRFSGKFIQILPVALEYGKEGMRLCA